MKRNLFESAKSQRDKASEAKKAEAPMKKYYFEATKVQWEKPTEPKYLFCATAKTFVFAETEEQAEALAREKLREEYAGTGCLLGEPKLVTSAELPVDWSYGYGDQRRSGPTDKIGDLVGSNVIR